MKKHGFTLVELLVVVGIISLLAGLLMASLSSARAKSRDGVRKSDLNQIRTALEQSSIDTGAYPQAANNGTGITCERWTQTSALGSGMLAIQNAQYASVVPRPPQPGENYGYATNAQDRNLFNLGVAGTLVPPGSITGTNLNTQYVLEARLERSSSSATTFWHVRSNGVSSEHPTTVPLVLGVVGC